MLKLCKSCLGFGAKGLSDNIGSHESMVDLVEKPEPVRVVPPNATATKEKEIAVSKHWGNKRQYKTI